MRKFASILAIVAGAAVTAPVAEAHDYYRSGYDYCGWRWSTYWHRYVWRCPGQVYYRQYHESYYYPQRYYTPPYYQPSYAPYYAPSGLSLNFRLGHWGHRHHDRHGYRGRHR